MAKKYPMEYGRVSETTQKVGSLIGEVSSLGSSDNASITEVVALIEKIDSQFSDIDDIFVDAAKKLLTDIADDGVISEEERDLLSQFSALYDTPISDEPIEVVDGKVFVLSGDFEIDGGKTAVTEMLDAAGAEVKSGVSRKVSYVVVGGLGSDAWAFGNFGTKVKKALDLKLTGKADISIVSEKALLAHLLSTSPEAKAAMDNRAARYERQRASTKVVSRDFSGLTEGQQQVLDLAEAGRNIFLTGLGGTGKSYVLDLIIGKAKEEGKNVIVCASTGIAALNIGGSTIHRALGIWPGKTLQLNARPHIKEDSPLLECDLMIVDEVSMCRMDLFDYLSLTLRLAASLRKEEGKGLCQLIVVGDFSQLPPVVRSEEKSILNQKYGFNVGNAYPFMGSCWDSWNFAKVELTEAIRQRDADFVEALNACRIGDTSGLHWIEEHAAAQPAKKAIVLCGRNDEAARENKKHLNKLTTPEFVYHGVLKGKVDESDLPTEKKLKLKVGARVMALVNNSEKTFMNGSLGDVIDCDDDSVSVRFDNGYEGVIHFHEWEITRPVLSGGKTKVEVIGTFEQIPLKLAYALTIHKAQGQTFESASIYPDCWDPGQLYTALSRLTSIDGLYLAHSCPDSSLIASPEVIAFNEGNYVRPRKSAV